MARAAFTFLLASIVVLATMSAPKLQAQTLQTPSGDDTTATDNDPGAGALQSTIDSYIAAYNEGMVDAVMSFYAPNADFVDIHGRFHEGRDVISALFRRGFADNPGRTIELNSASRKFLTPEVAVDDGTLVLTSPDGTQNTGRYTVVWTRIDSKWLIRSARDIPIEMETEATQPEASPLEELGWLVGHWESKSDDRQVTLNCEWTLEENFLVQDYHVQSDEEDFRVVAYIGFDPIESRFRAWFFDSRGGFGGGTWMRVNEEYHMTSVTVLADGQLGTSVMTWKRNDDDTVTLHSTERVVGGESLPDTTQTYTRVK